MKTINPKMISNIKLGHLCYYLKIHFYILLFLFINFTLLKAQWERKNNGITGGPINCFIIDGKNTYTGIDGGVFMTTDNGDTWIAKNNGFISFIGLDVESLAISSNNIFAGTFFDGIFLSTDKGENWIRKSNGLPFKVYNNNDTLFWGIFYSLIISGNNIIAGTQNGVYISANYGNNWSAKNNGLPQLDSFNIPVYSLAISGNNIFAGTRFGVYMTSDNGENWKPKNKGMENMDITALALIENKIYAGTNGLFQSTDNGDNWKYIGMKNTAIMALLIKGNYVFAGGGGFYLSSNNGKDWTSNLLDDGAKTIIINGDYIFAGVGEILRAKLSDLGITDVKETEQINKNSIYPNPASDEFRLKFQTPTETTVQLSVFDLLGNLVLSQTLQSTEGMNEKNINCEKLPQGYYYVKINVNENVQSIPLMIIK